MTASKFFLFNIIAAIPFLFSTCAGRTTESAKKMANKAQTETAKVEWGYASRSDEILDGEVHPQ